MFEVGKCNVQYCYGYDDEIVFLDKITDYTADYVSTLGITIHEDYMSFEAANYIGGFDEEIEELYVQIPDELFEKLYSLFGENQYDIDTPEQSPSYIAQFKDICKGKWRNMGIE